MTQVLKLAQVSWGRSDRRQENLPPAGFEDRDDHRTTCASRKAARIRADSHASKPSLTAQEKVHVQPRQSVASSYSSRRKPILLGHFGWGTMRRYGLGDFHPPGYCF